MGTISFIIINYRTKLLTCSCIESIISNNTLNNYKYEIVVVDNNSGDDSVKWIRDKKYPNTKVIENSENEGFGKANNLGVWESNGKFIVLLNSDTEVTNTNFDQLFKIIKENNDIGVLSTKILNQDNSIQSLGFNFPSLINELKMNLLFWNFNIVMKLRLRNYKNKGLYKIDWVSGCFMVIRKEDFISVGGFDEKIFMYAEDIDLCYRLKNKKKYSYVLDETTVTHLLGKSSSNTSLKKLLNIRKSYYYVIRKNNIINEWKLPLMKFSYFLNALAIVLVKKL